MSIIHKIVETLKIKKFGVYIEKTIYHSPKRRVIKDYLSDWKMKFTRLCNYADMIKHINPSSSCWVKIDEESQLGKILFVYLNVWFDALKRRWLKGCRKINGFHGFFGSVFAKMNW